MNTPITVVSPEEAETADVVVCMRVADGPAYFTDDLFGTCSECGAEIRFRPHAPKWPPKVCMPCGLDRMQGGRA